jgi:rubrerythrin
MIKIGAWKEENLPIELSDISRKNLQETKQLEFEATQFYRAAAKETQNPLIKGFFKYLARTEKEHYEVACKLLGDEISAAIDEASIGKGEDLENLKESQTKEEHVTALYKKFAEEAVEPRVKEIFIAISEVEADHIELDKEEIAQIDGE